MFWWSDKVCCSRISQRLEPSPMSHNEFVCLQVTCFHPIGNVYTLSRIFLHIVFSAHESRLFQGCFFFTASLFSNSTPQPNPPPWFFKTRNQRAFWPQSFDTVIPEWEVPCLQSALLIEKATALLTGLQSRLTDLGKTRIFLCVWFCRNGALRLSHFPPVV